MSASRAIAASVLMEQTVMSSGVDRIVLRGGLFYGPGTGFDDDWHLRAAAGKLRVPGDGGDFVSLVHIEDLAVATVAAVARGIRLHRNSCRPGRTQDRRPDRLSVFPPQEPAGAWRARVAPFYASYRFGLVR